MGTHLRLVPQRKPGATADSLKYMDTFALDDARADHAAGDEHLWELQGKVFMRGAISREEWARYRRTYETEARRLAAGHTPPGRIVP